MINHSLNFNKKTFFKAIIPAYVLPATLSFLVGYFTNDTKLIHESNSYIALPSLLSALLSLYTYKVIFGNKGWIENVFVDAASRGKGIGRKLINLLIEVGEKKGLSEILLFTEDHRLAAINLYSSVGFNLKDSRIYCKKK